MGYKSKPRIRDLIVAVTLLCSLVVIASIALLSVLFQNQQQQQQQSFAQQMDNMGSMGYANYTTSTFITYQNAAMNIKIGYPSVWKTTEHISANTKVLEFIAPPESHMDTFPPVVTVSVRNLTLSNNV